MDNIDYKKIFIRFLKENDVYEIWLKQIKSFYWKDTLFYFWKYVHPVDYINKSIRDSWFDDRKDYREFNEKMIGLDFEWKLILSKINEKYWEYVLKFIDSNFFDTKYVNHGLYYHFINLRRKNN